MHFGHTYDNYGPLDYLDVGYKSNGLQIGKERASIIGSGTLANAPVASASNQNLFYMSTDFGLCLSRRAVYLNGPDTLTFAPVASGLKAIDWSFSFGFRDDNPAQDVFARYVQFLAGALPNFVLVANLSGGIDISFRNDGSTAVHVLTMTALYNNSKSHRLTVGMRSGLFYAFSDIEAEKTLAVPNWNGTGFTSVVVSDHATSIRPLMTFDIRQNTNVSVDCFKCDDALGTTVIANQCTPSRPATLNDSTAHTYSWIPMSLLQ